MQCTSTGCWSAGLVVEGSESTNFREDLVKKVGSDPRTHSGSDLEGY